MSDPPSPSPSDAAPPARALGATVALLVGLQVTAGVAILAPHAGFFGMTGAALAWGPEAALLPLSLLLGVALHRRGPALVTAYPRPAGPAWVRRGIALLALLTALSALGVAARAAGMDAEVLLVRQTASAAGFLLAVAPALYLSACVGRELWRSWHVGPLLTAQAVLLGAAALAPLSRGMLIPGATASLVWIVLALALRFRRWGAAEGRDGAHRLHHARLLRVPIADAALVLLLVAIPAGGMVPGAGMVLTAGAIAAWTHAWLRAGPPEHPATP